MIKNLVNKQSRYLLNFCSLCRFSSVQCFSKWNGTFWLIKIIFGRSYYFSDGKHWQTVKICQKCWQKRGGEKINRVMTLKRKKFEFTREFHSVKWYDKLDDKWFCIDLNKLIPQIYDEIFHKDEFFRYEKAKSLGKANIFRSQKFKRLTISCV